MDRTRFRIPFLIAALAGLLALGGPVSQAAPAKKPSAEAVPGELLIGFRSGVSAAAQKKLLKDAGLIEKHSFKKIHGALARTSGGSATPAIEQLQRDPRVRYAEPNFIVHADAVPNDPSYGQLWGMDRIDAPRAWDVTTGSSGVTVAVIDTGVDWSHPDLSSQIWINPGENCAGCRTDGTDNDHNGYVDDWHGWDFVSDDNNPTDDHGHGTHVAGTIGATGNNGIGVAGVNWNVRVMPVKFLNAQGSGTTADAISAVLYSADNGADISNNSWAGDDFSQALADAIGVADQRDQLFVAAAGNQSNDNDESPTYPASYDLPNMITVAATDEFDDIAYFSNVGRRSVDLGAPGVNIYSTWPGASYQTLSGTSMATPHVAGAAALAKAEFPSASAPGLKALLLDSVDPNPALAEFTATGGQLNVGTAVTCSGAPKLFLDSPGAGFSVDVGTPVSFSAIAANCADASGVTVAATVNGTVVGMTARGDGLYSGTYTPTARGAVTISITATAGGSSTTRTVTGSATQAYPITAGGPPVTITTTAPDENAQLRFSGTAGQRVSLQLSAVTISASLISILSPSGATLASGYSGTSGAFIDTHTLPVTGAYTIVVDPIGAGTGSMTLTLYDVPADATGTITPGAPTTVANGTPGQNARVTFSGTAGQRISLKLSGVTASLAFVSILKPDGSALASPTYLGPSGGFVDTRTLPAAGTYTILFDPQYAATGSVTLTLYDVPADAGGPIAPNGTSTSISTSTPGQNGRLTFNGTAGQRITLKISGVSYTSAFVSIVRPDGAAVGTNAFIGTGGGFIDTRSLPVTGAYSIFVDPQSTATGSATFNLYDVPPDAGGTMTAGGAPLTATMATPGQNARITFEGQAGQRISLKISQATLSAANLSIAKPDGSTLVSNTLFGSAGTFIDTRTLPSAGTYTITIDPQGTATGSATLTLYDVPADTTGNVSAGGPPLTISMSTPGQNARITFDGRAGQSVSLRFSSVTVTSSYVSILKPDGTTLVPQTFVTSVGRTITATLPSDGSYTIVIDPQGAATGSMTLTLS
jgi:subtilisin family serine protease